MKCSVKGLDPDSKEPPEKSNCNRQKVEHAQVVNDVKESLLILWV